MAKGSPTLPKLMIFWKVSGGVVICLSNFYIANFPFYWGYIWQWNSAKTIKPHFVPKKSAQFATVLIQKFEYTIIYTSIIVYNSLIILPECTSSRITWGPLALNICRLWCFLPLSKSAHGTYVRTDSLFYRYLDYQSIFLMQSIVLLWY